jgi:hypothetical protein
MCILDGNAYDAKCLEAGVERDDDLDSCSLLLNNKSTPLLQPGGSGSHTPDNKVLVQLSVGRFLRCRCTQQQSPACHPALQHRVNCLTWVGLSLPSQG